MTKADVSAVFASPLTTERQHLWAIDTRSKEGHGLIGRFWSEVGHERWPSFVPVGARLFKTRALARDFLHRLKSHHAWVAFPNAQVVRVLLTIEATGR